MDMVYWPVVRWRARTATGKRAAAMVAWCVRLGVDRARERSSGVSEVEGGAAAGVRPPWRVHTAATT
jgi:hypothetical protein